MSSPSKLPVKICTNPVVLMVDDEYCGTAGYYTA
jgi:hypothetical protein